MWIAVNEIWDFYALQCSFNPQVQLYNDNSVNVASPMFQVCADCKKLSVICRISCRMVWSGSDWSHFSWFSLVCVVLSGLGDFVFCIPSAVDAVVRSSNFPMIRCLLRACRRWSPGRLA